MTPTKPTKAEATYDWYCPVCCWSSHRSDEINFHYRYAEHALDPNIVVPDLKYIHNDVALFPKDQPAIVDVEAIKSTVKFIFSRKMAPGATTQGKRKFEDLDDPPVSNLPIATSSRNPPHSSTSNLGQPNPKYLDKNPDLAATEPVTAIYPEVVGNPKFAGLLVESEMRLNVSSKFPFIEKPAVIEERNGEIEVHVVNNDGTHKHAIILGGLKCIFQKQLPKMPKDYIARLVFDRTHISMAIVKHPLEVVGGITYRPFENRQFAEIVFCAISSDQQVKGYGSHLMNHLKDYVKATSDIMHFLTYADNYAIGYFKKQGFSKDIELPGERWVGYIKDYEGGTLMHCEMLPKIRYLTAARMLHKQREAIAAKMAAQKRSQVIYPPPAQFQGPGPIKSITDPYSLPGLRESGWTPEMDALSRQPRHGPNYAILSHLLASMQRHSQSWPFANPVNKDDVQDYYDVITEPMDLNTMEKKLEKDNYVEPEDFLKDAKLIFNNCRKYNGESSLYVKCANKLEKSMWSEIKKIPEWSHLAEA